MDLVTAAKRVSIAMQYAAKSKPKIVNTCTLPLTSARSIDLVVSKLAVVELPGRRETLLETSPRTSG